MKWAARAEVSIFILRDLVYLKRNQHRSTLHRGWSVMTSPDCESSFLMPASIATHLGIPVDKQ